LAKISSLHVSSAETSSQAAPKIAMYTNKIYADVVRIRRAPTTQPPIPHRHPRSKIWGHRRISVQQ